MSIDRTMSKPDGHVCQRPKILDWSDTDDPEAPPDIWYRFEVGTRFTCDDCGRVLVCWDRPTRNHGGCMVMGEREWRDETRWERLCRRWSG